MESNQPGFEEKLNSLSDIVKELGTGNLSLTDSINKFQAGMTLSQQLKSELSEANAKIAHIIEDNDSKTDITE